MSQHCKLLKNTSCWVCHNLMYMQMYVQAFQHSGAWLWPFHYDTSYITTLPCFLISSLRSSELTCHYIQVWILYDTAKHPAHYYAMCHSESNCIYNFSITLAEPNTNFIWFLFNVLSKDWIKIVRAINHILSSTTLTALHLTAEESYKHRISCLYARTLKALPCTE